MWNASRLRPFELIGARFAARLCCSALLGCGTSTSPSDAASPRDDAAAEGDGAEPSGPGDAGVERDAAVLPDARPSEASLDDAALLADAAAQVVAEGACFDGDSGCVRALTLEEAMAQYPQWQRRTSEPQPVGQSLLGLCRIPSPNEVAFVDTLHGGSLWLLDWLNPPANEFVPPLGELLPTDHPFAVGAAIVKEKHVRNVDASFSLVALGAMVKQPRGFDPAHGDWEFGYWEAASGWRGGKDTARLCGDCHSVSESDHVFLDGRWEGQDAGTFPADAGGL